jgi:response regulator RpfG family c-di-GMP phosphodiesterase
VDHAPRRQGVASGSQPAQHLGLSRAEIRRIRIASDLHDVGEVAIPDTIVTEPDPLDEKEWSFIHRHTEIGERIVRSAPSLANAAQLVRSSHEHHGPPADRSPRRTAPSWSRPQGRHREGLASRVAIS